MPTLEDIKQQISSLDGASRLLGRREIKELPAILWEDELVEQIVQGMYNSNLGILIATNKRLVFVDKKIFGVKVEDFPYDKLTSIQYETKLLYGSITIFASGNRANIEKIVPKDQVRGFAEYVRAKITSQHTSQSEAPQPQEDNLDKLRKLAVLYKHGVLTKAEFEDQKKKLLA